MKRSPHLLVSESPLKEGMNYVSLCGRPIVKAAFVFMWDADGMGTYEIVMPGFCRKCCKEFEEETAHYIYGVIDGELVRNPEVEA